MDRLSGYLERGTETGSAFAIRDYCTNSLETIGFAVKNRVNTIKTIKYRTDSYTESIDDAFLARLRQLGIRLKEIFQAFIDDHPAAWQEREKEHADFFEKTHCEDLKGHIDIPPSKLKWVNRWFDFARWGRHKDLVADEKLH